MAEAIRTSSVIVAVGYVAFAMSYELELDENDRVVSQ